MTKQIAARMTTEQAVEAIRQATRSAITLRNAGRARWAFRFEKDAVVVAEAHGLRVADVIG